MSSADTILERSPTAGTPDAAAPPHRAASVEPRPDPSTDVVTEHRARVRGRRRRQRVGRASLHVAFVGFVLAVWEFGSGRYIDALLVSSPTAVIGRLGEWITSGHLAFHLRFTLTAFVIAFVLGATVAFLSAVALAQMPRFGRFSEIYVIVFNGIPNIALVPVLIVWFGFGIETKIVMGYLSAFFIIFIASFQALRNTDARFLELARVLGASKRQTLVRFRLLAAVPFLASAFKLALPVTALSVVTAEFLGSNRGLGFLLIRAGNLLDMASLFAAVFVVTALVQLLSIAASAIETRLLVWVPKEKR